MDIIICKIQYPNDPTNKLKVHQHFVGLFDGTQIVLYSISSIEKKKHKVFPNNKPNPDYFLFKNEYRALCNLRVPSFINCSTSFRLTLTADMDITKLANRTMPPKIKQELLAKIEEVKRANRHQEYPLSTEEFIKHNPLVIKRKIRIRR